MTLWTGRPAAGTPSRSSFERKSASASGNYLAMERVQKPVQELPPNQGVAVVEDDLSELDLTLVRLLYLFPLVVWGLLIYFAFS